MWLAFGASATISSVERRSLPLLKSTREIAEKKREHSAGKNRAPLKPQSHDLQIILTP
jgi:hypothetical protein